MIEGSSKMHDDNGKAEFEQVLKDELDVLDELRDGISANTEDSGYKRAHESGLAGLAFSGGGIRSATFNLGVIQALSNYGLLARFDYLSTVSGGGYIGGWLSALLHRKAVHDGVVNQQAVENFQSALKPHPEDSDTDESSRTVGFSPVEHKSVRYLRRYSNYLTPRLGLGGDMFAVISIFLRNFTLIQLSLISLVASILLLAHAIAAGSTLFSQDVTWVFIDSAWPGWLQWFVNFISSIWPFVISALALFVSVWWAGRLMAVRRTPDEKRMSTSRVVHYSVILPCMLAAWWFSAAIVTRTYASPTNDSLQSQALVWIAVPAICYAGAWMLGFYSRQRAIPGKQNRIANMDGASRLTLMAATVVSGIVFGLLLFATHCQVSKVSSAQPIDVWHAVGFGTPLFLLGLSFVVALHIGAVRRVFSEDDREWLARLGGFVLLYAAAWALIFSLVLYATPFVEWLAGGGLVALATWAVGSVVGANIARGSSTNGSPDGRSWKEIVTLFAPWVFVAGLAIIVTYATQVFLFKFLLADAYATTPDSDFFIAVMHTLQGLQELPVAGTLLALLGAVILFAAISWRLDINLFSLHALYCNRLARAYLGASRAGERQPNPFTGFDINDDLPFADLDRQRPVHIINTSINMTGGDDLAWQTRRAASFALTPRWSGYETRSSQGVKLGTYRPTAEYAGGRNLGTWVAVSGAAASPNMGYHTSAAVAALMTAFNLRLGRWCGNPDPVNKESTVWKQKSPGFATQPILAELTGSANTQADWVNLTDGGHFENLGVYELIRRRCRFIVVTDAGCDPQHKFEDLANLLRKCWTDFGVNICFEDFEAMHLKNNSRYCGAYGAVGRIEYKDGGPDGAIIYLKASMTGSEWPDIRQYADSHKDFPHETTADQFFDENQFEAYRHLGYKVAAMMAVKLQSLFPQQPLKDVATESIVSILLENRKILELPQANPEQHNQEETETQKEPEADA